MATFDILKWRLDEIENICNELGDRMEIKDLWADRKIYTIAIAVHNTLEEVLRHKKRIIQLEHEVEELKYEIQKKLGTNATVRIDDDF